MTLADFLALGPDALGALVGGAVGGFVAGSRAMRAAIRAELRPLVARVSRVEDAFSAHDARLLRLERTSRHA